jgi:hypothetical protein
VVRRPCYESKVRQVRQRPRLLISVIAYQTESTPVEVLEPIPGCTLRGVNSRALPPREGLDGPGPDAASAQQLRPRIFRPLNTAR